MGGTIGIAAGGEERLSLSSLVPPKRRLLCVLPEMPIEFLLPDLIFSGRAFVTRPVKVYDITCG